MIFKQIRKGSKTPLVFFIFYIMQLYIFKSVIFEIVKIKMLSKVSEWSQKSFFGSFEMTLLQVSNLKWEGR